MKHVTSTISTSSDPVTPASRPVSGAVRELLELITALDRRMPQVQRVGEVSISRDAAALRARALKRIDELEREAVHAADEV